MKTIEEIKQKIREDQQVYKDQYKVKCFFSMFF